MDLLRIARQPSKHIIQFKNSTAINCLMIFQLSHNILIQQTHKRGFFGTSEQSTFIHNSPYKEEKEGGESGGAEIDPDLSFSVAPVGQQSLYIHRFTLHSICIVHDYVNKFTYCKAICMCIHAHVCMCCVWLTSFRLA